MPPRMQLSFYSDATKLPYVFRQLSSPQQSICGSPRAGIRPRGSHMSASTAISSIPLKVAEGRSQDVGRGLARLDPVDMNRLSAGVGSIVQIVGKKVTAARVMPAYRDARGNEVVQLDGLTRSNAGAIIREQV